MLGKEFKNNLRQEIKAAECIYDVRVVYKKLILELLDYKIKYLNKRRNIK
jgi:hypothetical protein